MDPFQRQHYNTAPYVLKTAHYLVTHSDKKLSFKADFRNWHDKIRKLYLSIQVKLKWHDLKITKPEIIYKSKKRKNIENPY